MTYIFFFKCESCNYYIALDEGSYGWIDIKGNFGRTVIGSDTNLGEPEGEAYNIWYDIKLCTNCGNVYYTIEGDTHGIKVKQKQDIKEENVFIPDVFILVNEDFCPECQVKLLQGQEVLELVINREKCRRWNFVPLESEEEALKCPQCKEDYLLFDQFWLAD